MYLLFINMMIWFRFKTRKTSKVPQFGSLEGRFQQLDFTGYSNSNKIYPERDKATI
jgi:hypothetical protein